jgi:hypothetical protein
LPVSEGDYERAANDHAAFRGLLDEGFRATPELFPANFTRGYELKDDRTAVKQGLPIRRILLRHRPAETVRFRIARIAEN